MRSRLASRQGDAFLSPSVMTFRELAERVLAASGGFVRTARPIVQRRIVRRLVTQSTQSGVLSEFRRIADRAGFADLLTKLFDEIDRSGLGHSGFARLTGLGGDRGRQTELAELYGAYRKQLCDAGYISQAGLVTEAAEAWRGKIQGMAEHLDLVILDGFIDFAPPEERLIQALTTISSKLFVTLALEGAGADRENASPPLGPRELFAASHHALHRLAHKFPDSRIQSLSEQSSNWPALDHISRWLFRAPREIPVPQPEVLDSLHRLQIIAAAGVHDELEQIARKIKGKLVDGSARPNDFMVVYRSLGGIAERAQEVFDAAGLPVLIERRRTLANTALVRTLLALLQLDRDDWPFAAVLGVVCNRALGLLDGPPDRHRQGIAPTKGKAALPPTSASPPVNIPARMATEWLVRELQVPSGRDALLAAVGRLAREDTPPGKASDDPAAQRTLLNSGSEAGSRSPESNEHSAARSAFFRERDRRTRRRLAARAALPRLQLLSTALAELPDAATASRWLEALSGLHASLGAGDLLEGVPGPAGDRQHAGESRQAWQVFSRALASLAVNMPRFGDSPSDAWLISRQEMAELLTDVAASESLPPAADECGRVRILAASSARHVTAPHIFLAGLNEQAFPVAEPAGRLYRDASRGSSVLEAARHIGSQATPDLHRGGQAVDDAPDFMTPTHLRSEMRLFYDVITRAQESLTLSYPALDQAAQTLPPSPFLVEVERTLGKTAKIERIPPALSPLPIAAEAVSGTSASDEPQGRAGQGQRDATLISPAAWRVMAVSDAMRGDRDLLAGLLRDADQAPVGQAIMAGIHAVAQRASGRSFGPWEGILAGEAAQAALARRFGPQHDWSPSQLESYAACPFAFYMRHVLGLEPAGDLVLETDYRRRGSTLHNVLAEFHRRLTKTFGPSARLSQLDEATLLTNFRQVLDELADSSPAEGVEAALMELDRRKIADWGSKYLAQHVEYDRKWEGFAEPFVPAHFEVRFGPLRHAESARYEDPCSTEEPYLLELGDQTIRITGRIDRLDVGGNEGQRSFNVIDYKSASQVTLKSDDVASGRLLQLPLYTLVAEWLLSERQARPLHAGYWSLREKGFEAKKCLPPGGPAKSSQETADYWSELRASTAAKVGELILGIQRGEFPVVNENEECTSRCEFAEVCRVAQARSLDKSWPPELLVQLAGTVQHGAAAEGAQ